MLKKNKTGSASGPLFTSRKMVYYYMQKAKCLHALEATSRTAYLAKYT